jgi:hypothetical protein
MNIKESEQHAHPTEAQQLLGGAKRKVYAMPTRCIPHEKIQRAREFIEQESAVFAHVGEYKIVLELLDEMER